MSCLLLQGLLLASPQHLSLYIVAVTGVMVDVQECWSVSATKASGAGEAQDRLDKAQVDCG